MITPGVPAVLLEDLAVRVVAPGAPADLAVPPVPADLVTWAVRGWAQAVPVDLVAWAVQGWAKAVEVLVR
jgi:hypothetical protein